MIDVASQEQSPMLPTYIQIIWDMPIRFTPLDNIVLLQSKKVSTLKDQIIVSFQ